MVDAAQSIDTAINITEERMYQSKLKESQHMRYCIIASLERTLRETTEETQENACRTWIVAKTIGAALSLSFEELH